MSVKIIPVGMLQTNCCLLIDDQTKECAVIDPGAAGERILKTIADLGVTVGSIILTHGHFDHIMAAAEVQNATGAKLYIHSEDEHMLTADYVRHGGYIRGEYAPPRVDGHLYDGMTFTVGTLTCSVLNTPGHTKGSCVILCGDRMFSGDTLFADDCGRCDLEGGSEAEMRQSLRRLHDLEGDYHVHPGHDESTTLSRERLHNFSMRSAMGR